MPLFEYTARDVNGQEQRGSTLGANQKEALQKLRDRGLIVTQMAAAGGTATAAPSQGAATAQAAGAVPMGQAQPAVNTDPRSYAQQVSSSAVSHGMLTPLIFFFRQFGAMLHAGVNPAQSLQTLSGQTTSIKLAGILREAAEFAKQGHPISACFQKYPEVFSPMVISLVRAGEENGSLDIECRNIAEYLQHDLDIRNLIRRETLYPKLLVGAAVFILGGANIFIGIVTAGKGKGIASPLLSIGFWGFMIAALVAWFLITKVFMVNPEFREKWDRMLLRIPGIGKTVHGFAMARFGRAFGSLYRSGVPIPRATELSADACGNLAVRNQIYTVVNRLKDGATVSQAWTESGAFSPVVLDMAATGEQTGDLDSMLLRISDYYEDESRTRAKGTAQIFAMVILIGVMILIAITVINFWMGYFGGVMDLADPDK